MTITTDCPNCGKLIDSIPDEYAGKKAKCPGCNGKFIIPDEAADINQEFILSGIDDDPFSPMAAPQKTTSTPRLPEDNQFEKFEAVANIIWWSGIAVFFFVFFSVGATTYVLLDMPKKLGFSQATTAIFIGGVAAFVASSLYQGVSVIIRLLIIIARQRG